MDTRKKLREAAYHLDALRKNQANDEPFEFEMSAYLYAWRSILDVMLYDFSEFYSLGFTRNDWLDFDRFLKAAKAKKCRDAEGFICWWFGKQKVLESNQLWTERNVYAHRGYSGMKGAQTKVFYLIGSGGASGTILPFLPGSETIAGSSGGAIPTTSQAIHQVLEPPKRWEFINIPGEDAIAVCEKALDEMSKIVGEAEKEFKVKL